MSTTINSNQTIEALKNELEETKQKLKEKDFVFTTILESQLAGYWDWYIQDDYEYMSPTFKSMFGYRDDEMENKPSSWQKIIHPEDAQMALDLFEEHVKSRGEVPYTCNVRYYHKNGSIVWVFCKGRVIEWDEKGQPLRMVGSHVDITELKKAEAMRLNTIKLEEKNKQLENFVYVASHDLQEPLRTILSFIELFREDYKDLVDETGLQYLEFIAGASNRMRNLIKDLLDYSKIGKAVRLTKVDCQKLIQDLIDDMRGSIKATKAAIEFNDLPVVSGYEVELRLLFQNLISNSIKFTKKNTIPKINISVEEKAEYWLFSVKDNGIGIKEKDFEKIFVTFKRLNVNYEGTGIGLAHCKKIIELHKGEIKVESTPNVGSTFYFTIPK